MLDLEKALFYKYILSIDYYNEEKLGTIEDEFIEIDIVNEELSV